MKLYFSSAQFTEDENLPYAATFSEIFLRLSRIFFIMRKYKKMKNQLWMQMNVLKVRCEYENTGE